MNLFFRCTFVVIFCTISANVLGQTPKTKLIFSDLTFMTGVMEYTPAFIFAEEMKVLNPTSALLDADFSTYQNRPSSWFETASITHFSAAFHFEKRPMLGFRVGVSGWKRNFLSGFYNETNVFAYDTLISTQTGYEIPVDSVHTNWLGTSVNGSFFNFDLAFEFRTITNARWDFRTGIGISPGFVYNIRSTIAGGSNAETSPNFNFVYADFNSANVTPKQEVIRNNGLFNLGIFVPINLGFTLGKKSEFWSRLQLNLQVRPTFNFIPVKNVITVQEFTISQSLGIRYQFN